MRGDNEVRRCTPGRIERVAQRVHARQAFREDRMPELDSSNSGTQPYSGFDHLFVAGRWRNGRSNRVNRDLNPWTGEP